MSVDNEYQQVALRLKEIQSQVNPTFKGFIPPEAWEDIIMNRGKVRDMIPGKDGDTAGETAMITTDRISAYDQKLGAIRHKGQAVQNISRFWFDETQGIFPNHLLEVVGKNVMIVKTATPVPIEVVVRGYMTGVTDTSVWGSYEKEERTIYGIDFIDGYNKGDKLEKPVITPTTKAKSGHDERITESEIIQSGIVSAEDWNTISKGALALFSHAQEVSKQKGLLLLDTKMEFGWDEHGELMVIDELFTPDSSRYVLASNYKSRLEEGKELDHYDKEYFRMAYKTQLDPQLQGDFPPIDENLATDVSARYIWASEQITGQEFKYQTGDVNDAVHSQILTWRYLPRTGPKLY